MRLPELDYAALQLAEARLRGVGLLAVHAWALPLIPGREIAPTTLFPIDDLRREVEEGSRRW